ncbi:MOSC domain-containing protein [Beggiatoa leptomitoformis]|uniref:MOSC domain-containing protein n=1 Tax=Beggiatoa leptomitoformis TaxID=288004 RepID=A0A2N9YD46_9GAMM|nr:MOSC domain-containing protein [Beggiatoa leptomitoformis]ALG69191.1 MOSC domain-containing protein [Beggiatoa leptomitoformis]AUI68380.1 MOSC domain-containing protein [Beggiatoa leptomitoformis]
MNDATLTQLFIGTLRPLPPEGQLTGIYKHAVTDSISVTPLGLTGDHQADKRVHGGTEKAIHHYAAENYALLAQQYPNCSDQFIAGSLGENFSSDGLHENNVCIGDIFQVGQAILQVSQPRSPCWKINHKFGLEQISMFIQQQNITGWYYRVLQTGYIQAGDKLLLVERPNADLTLAHFWNCVLEHRPAIAIIESISLAIGLAPQWQQRLKDRAVWLGQHH